jgi:hypothetical protein
MPRQELQIQIMNPAMRKMPHRHPHEVTRQLAQLLWQCRVRIPKLRGSVSNILAASTPRRVNEKVVRKRLCGRLVQLDHEVIHHGRLGVGMWCS